MQNSSEVHPLVMTPMPETEIPTAELVLVDAAVSRAILLDSSPADLGVRVAKAFPYFDGFAINTQKSLIACWRVWAEYSANAGIAVFPPSLVEIEAFLEHSITEKKRKRATIKQYLFALDQMFRFGGMPNPMRSKAGQMMWRAVQRRHKGTIRAKQNQKAGLREDDLQAVLAANPGNDLASIRDRALISVAYDSMTRRSEVVGMTVEDLERVDGGTGAIHLPYSKSDQDGEGERLPLSAESMELLDEWLRASKITTGAIWRSLPGHWRGTGPVETPVLSDRDVARILKRRAAKAGMDSSVLAGHSMRIGAAKDVVAAGASTLQAMQAGRWKSAGMVARYTKNLADADNAVMKFRKAAKAKRAASKETGG